MRISDWSSDVCSSDLGQAEALALELESSGAPRKIRQVGAVVAPKAVLELCDLWQRVPGVSGSSLADGLLAASRAVRATRSEERRVGKECVSTGRSGWSPDH